MRGLLPLIRIGTAAVLFLVAVCSADTLVTVDSSNVAIVYDPPNSWEEIDGTFDFDGSHMFTEDPDATATLTFSGTAIFFWSPLFPFPFIASLSLDNAAPVPVSLQDPASPVVGNPDLTGDETVQSAVVWSMTGLDPTVPHTLVVSVGPGQTFAVLDSLQYTVPDPLDPGSTSTSTFTPISTPLTTATATLTTTPTPTIPSTLPLSTLPFTPSDSLTPSSSKTETLLPTPTTTAVSAATSSSSPPGLSTAIGIVCALAALLALAALAWWWRRRRRERREREIEEAAAEAQAQAEGGLGGVGFVGYAGSARSNGHGAGPEMKEATGEMGMGTGGATLGRSRSARYRDIAAYFANDDSGKKRVSTVRTDTSTLPSVSGSSARGSGSASVIGSGSGGSKTGSGGSGGSGRRPTRRKAPPLPPSAEAKRKSETLGTIPEVHPRDGEDLASDEARMRFAGGAAAGSGGGTGALAKDLGLYVPLSRDLGREGMLARSGSWDGREPVTATNRMNVTGRRPISGMTATTMTTGDAETTTSGRDADVEAWTIRP